MIQFPRIRELHKETQKEMGVPLDEKLWPPSWSTIEYKEYPRFRQFSLPEPQVLSAALSTILSTRQSKRDFNHKETLSSQELSDFLFWSIGKKSILFPEYEKEETRMHPSGGGRYPLELYISFRGNEEIPQGVYHYNIKTHTLEQLRNEDGDRAIRSTPLYPWMPDAAALFFISAVFDRSMRKYRERGYRFITLEAGIVLENFYLVGTALDLSLCACGTNNETVIENLLDLNPETESVITQFVVGK